MTSLSRARRKLVPSSASLPQACEIVRDRLVLVSDNLATSSKIAELAASSAQACPELGKLAASLPRACREVVRDRLVIVSDNLTRSSKIAELATSLWQAYHKLASCSHADLKIGYDCARSSSLPLAWRSAVPITTRLANQRVRLTASQPIGETVINWAT